MRPGLRIWLIAEQYHVGRRALADCAVDGFHDLSRGFLVRPRCSSYRPEGFLTLRMNGAKPGRGHRLSSSMIATGVLAVKKSFTRANCILAALVGLGAAGFWPVLPAHTASSFVCPETHAGTTGAALKETPADLASVTDALKGPELENAVRVIIGDLKRKYPDADKADIVNYLLAAYCPLVAADDGLSQDEMRERMDRFSSMVFKILGE